jgi:uncharacterized membrane-anchored protein
VFEIGGSRMNDKQVFLTIVGGMIFAVFGGLLLFGPISLLFQRDGGDDGFGLIWLLLSVLSGIAGVFLSARWVRKRYSDDVTPT